jgi:hypothetical protein
MVANRPRPGKVREKRHLLDESMKQYDDLRGRV